MSERTIIINCEKLETRVAFLNDELLEEYYIERETKDNIVGSIFYGRIESIQPSLKAVFVDIGMEKNAFMHFHDMLPATFEEMNIREGGNSRRRIKLDEIPEMFPVGSFLFVQVTKGAIGTKGPRVTTNISLPGRYLVLLPFSDHMGISKRIESNKERNRLKNILTNLELPERMGCICRTVGEGRKSVYFDRDLKMLLEFWNEMEDKGKKSRKPCLVYKEMSLLEKSMRDFLTEDIGTVVIDDKETFSYIKDFISKVINKSMSKRIKLYQKASPIFEYYGVKEKISKIFNRKVYLPSGGYICIDETEALIAIDVNTGSSRSASDMDEHILNTNLEAAEEIVRQMKLRNIGGLVVIDFIDMRYYNDNDKVFKKMKKLLRSDRAKTRALPISHLGLMQMTRQRERESLLDRIFAPCPYCQGTGKVKSTMSVSVDIQRVLKEILKRKVWDSNLEVRVIMHPAVFARMKNEDDGFLKEIEEQFGRSISFRSDTSVHLEEFKVIDPQTDEDLLEYTNS